MLRPPLDISEGFLVNIAGGAGAAIDRARALFAKAAARLGGSLPECVWPALLAETLESLACMPAGILVKRKLQGLAAIGGASRLDEHVCTLYGLASTLIQEGGRDKDSLWDTPVGGCLLEMYLDRVADKALAAWNLHPRQTRG
jgi:hypothetical protein